MFRVTLPLLFCACAADKLAIQSYVSQVSETLSLARFNGNSRASGMAAGLRDMSLRLLEKQPEDQDEVVAQFQTLIDNMNQVKDNLVVSRDNDQDELNEAHGDVSQCAVDEGGVHAANIANLQATENAKRTEHQSCRGREATAKTATERACTSFQEWLNARIQNECGYPAGGPTDNQKVNDWYNFLDLKATEYNTHIEDYPGERQPCADNHSDYVSTQAECSSAMSDFETAACAVKIAMDMYCDNQATCHTNAAAAFEGVKDRLIPLSAQRIEDGGAVEFVICLLEALRDNFNATTVDDLNNAVGACTLAKDSYNFSSLGNDFHDTPDEQPCTRDDLFPGEDLWLPTEFPSPERDDWDMSGLLDSCVTD